MNGVRQSWLVAKRELRERSRSRAFLASLAIMVIGVVGVIALPTLLNNDGTKDVGITGSTPGTLTEAITAQGNAVGTTTRIYRYDTVTDGEQAIRDGKVDVLIVDANTLEWQTRADPQLEAVATAAIQISTLQQRADAAGVTGTQLGALLAPVTVSSVELGQVAGRSPDDETATFIMTVVLFMTIATYGAMVLNGVVEEKASRVVEVLLARMPARSLLAGKIAGIGLLGLGQVAVTALAALIAVRTISGVDLPAVTGAVLAWAVVWFVLGYAMYATLFGALGSLASRPEDAQSAAGPISVLLVVVYFVSFAAIGSPDTAWARAISWLPIAAPIAMPARIAMGAATWWEPTVAAALTLAAIAGLVVLGGRIYTAAVLHSGPTLKLRAMWHTEVAHDALPAPGSPATGIERHSRTTTPRRSARSAAVTVVVATAVGGLAIVVTNDVIIGVAVGAALFAVIDRLTRASRQPPPAGPQAGTDLVDAGRDRADQGGRR
jgi:ABC-2 type transport system permease protein